MMDTKASSTKAMACQMGGMPGTTSSSVNTTATGQGAVASDEDALANGQGAQATGFHSTAVGTQSVASGRGATATGWQARATGALSTANGNSAVASGENSTAVGRAATASGANSMALGASSSATAANSVALGNGSTNDRANSVSVGSVGGERQITNVAASTLRNDAVNFGQFTDGLTDLRAYADRRFFEQDERIDKLGAMNSAMSTMLASAAGIKTENRIAVGAGFAGGESALAIGYQRAIGERASFTLGGSFTDDESTAGIGFGYGW